MVEKVGPGPPYDYRITCNRCDIDIVYFNLTDRVEGTAALLRQHKADCRGAEV